MMMMVMIDLITTYVSTFYVFFLRKYLTLVHLTIEFAATFIHVIRTSLIIGTIREHPRPGYGM